MFLFSLIRKLPERRPCAVFCYTRRAYPPSQGRRNVFPTPPPLVHDVGGNGDGRESWTTSEFESPIRRFRFRNQF